MPSRLHELISKLEKIDEEFSKAELIKYTYIYTATYDINGKKYDMSILTKIADVERLKQIITRGIESVKTIIMARNVRTYISRVIDDRDKLRLMDSNMERVSFSRPAAVLIGRDLVAFDAESSAYAVITAGRSGIIINDTPMPFINIVKDVVARWLCRIIARELNRCVHEHARDVFGSDEVKLDA